MRITRTKTTVTCPLCRQPLEAGGLGATIGVSAAFVQRGHVECVKKWHAKRIAEAKRVPDAD